jgi:hypothetical protein
MKKQVLSLGVALAAILTTAAGANAASFTVNATDGACGSFGCTSSVAGAINIDFESGLPTTGFAQYSLSGNAGINLSGSAAPAQDTSKFLGVGTNSSVTINFGGLVDYFGLYWGSIDTYNFVDLYKGGNLLKTIAGAQAATTPNGNQTSPTTNRYIDIFANDAASNFDKVVLRSTGFAFEVDNNAYRRAVPVPGLALGAFVAGVGLLARKHQTKSA